MTPTALDHAIAALLTIGVPLYGAREWRALLSAVAAGDRGARLREYRWTIVLEWGLVALVMIAWGVAQRPVGALGFQLPADRQLFWGAGLTVLALGVLWLQWRAVQGKSAEELAPLRAQVEPMAALLPHTPEERRRFRWVALTAGTAEEILYRGYLIWYFGALLGVWPGVVAAVLAFAAGHAYQGTGGVLKTGVVGALLAGLYVLGGSLLWPMLLHVAIDLQGGAFGFRLLAPYADTSIGTAASGGPTQTSTSAG
jgi:membrane protease YdiL (CAAX protease family)